MMDNITNTLVDNMLDDIKAKIIREETIDVLGLLHSVGADTAGLNRVRDLLIKHKQVTRAEWNSMAQSARKASLYGRTPRDATDFVALWVEHNKVQARFNKTINMDKPLVLDGETVTKEARASSTSIDAYACIVGDGDTDIESMVRQLRLENESMGYGCSNTSIMDAAMEWFNASSKQRRWEVYGAVAHYQRQRRPDNHWEKFANAFDHSEHSAEFVIAVFQKFMWQVKRKMLGLPIMDHLMPVVLGAQGTGKSTFIRERLLTPVNEVTFDTNFAQVTNEKIIDMWEFNVLFLDEMGFASKTDVDEVKNVVTSAFVPRRPMGFNTIKQQPQRAVFIGCSNKEMDQLIRDETGVRRFVGVRFSHKPNREEINSIDFEALWCSVDERGPDPMIPHMDALRSLQAASKATTPVEEWYMEYAPYADSWGRDIASASLYSEFASWCTGKYERHVDLGGFTREFNRVIKSDPNSRWTNKRKKAGNAFIYN